jgi:trehalose-6-phosphate hydrolase
MLLALRKSEPIIVDGSFNLLFAQDKQLFTYDPLLGRKKLQYMQISLGSQLKRLQQLVGKIIMANYETPFGKGMRPFEFIMWKSK